MSSMVAFIGRVRCTRNKSVPLRTRPVVRVLPLLILVTVVEWSVFSKKAQGDPAFDSSTLEARGIDPALADYLREKSRFRAGKHVVDLIVNGRKKGLASVLFDHEGNVCFNADLLEKAGLIVPPGVLQGRCEAFLEAFPQAEVTLRPGQNEVALVVPSQAVRKEKVNAGAFVSGGSAGVFNYEVLGQESRSDGRSDGYLSASSLVGVNAGDWIVRSRQQWVADEQGQRSDHLYAYGQRDYRPWELTFQGGQINTRGPLFNSLPISGIQIFPDQLLRNPQATGAQVSGIATSQSRVEVRQAGVMIYSTVVPEGPFELGELPLISNHSDLDVRVIGSSGGQRQFTVPATTFQGVNQLRPGYYMAVGRVRDVSARQALEESPWVATATGIWSAGYQSMLSAGLATATDFQSAGWGIDTRLFEHTSLRFSTLAAKNTRANSKGFQSSLALTMPLPIMGGGYAGFSTTFRSHSYRELLDVRVHGDDDRLRFKSQHTATLGGSTQQWGGMNLSYVRSELHNGQHRQRLSGGWNRPFADVMLSLNVETAFGAGASRGEDPTAVLFSVSMPLGRSGHLRSYASYRGERAHLGTTYSDQLNSNVSYRVSADRDLRHRETWATGNLEVLTRYNHLGVGASERSAGSSYWGQLKGGVAAHSDGVTFSPYPILDTFAIVTVGDLAGVEVSTPTGPVWTDQQGQAVISGMTPYRRSRVEVATQTLPRRVDIKNGYHELAAGRGSVSKVDFGIIRVRRLLLQIRDTNGQPIEPGASVLNADNQFLTSVVSGGKVFLQDVESLQTLKITASNTTLCELTLDLPEPANTDAFYETASATCAVQLPGKPA